MQSLRKSSSTMFHSLVFKIFIVENTRYLVVVNNGRANASRNALSING